MAAWTLKRFSSPEILRQIEPSHLQKFLEPHRRFLVKCGIELSSPGHPITLDYPALVRLFLSPNKDTPPELIEALYMVDEMATTEGMDSLLEEAERRGMVFAEDVTPADIAVQIWTDAPELLERKHAEHAFVKQRSFEHYGSREEQHPPFQPTQLQLRAVESDLDTWFEKKKRGRGARLFVISNDDGIGFMARHGDPIKREESLDGTKTSSVCYRPVRYDAIVWSQSINELSVHAGTKSEKQLYRRCFGKHFFGDEEYFPGQDKHTLDPLRDLDAASLATGDVVGIEWIKLREYQLYFGGNYPQKVTYNSPDHFAGLEARKQTLPRHGKIIKATFQVKFQDAKSPRSVTIKPPNVALYTRDSDSDRVERWLLLRGFIKPKPLLKNGKPDKVLVGT